jgi:MFS family permease
VFSQTLVQTEVADAVRGRVNSLWGMASLGGAAFGGLLLGGLLQLLNLRGATVATAVIALVLPLGAWRAASRAPREAPSDQIRDPSEEFAGPL